MLKQCIIIFTLLTCNIIAEPILLRNADELTGQHTENTNQRTLLGNVILQQKNVTVKANQAIQYMNTNRFLLNGNVIITQDNLTLKSESILYDGNSYIATSDRQVNLTDNKSFLIGDRGKYSTQTMIANFYDNVYLEDDSTILFANNITYDRRTTESFAEGNVIIKSKNKNIFAQADSVFNFPNRSVTFAKSNPVLFQIDTNEDLTLDTLTIKSDSILANREEDIYYFFDNVEIVRNGLKAIAQQGIYNKNEEKIILYNPDLELKSQSTIWLDSTQLHADSIVITLKENKLQTIHAHRNSIHISYIDTLNYSRIDQLSGNTIIIHIENDTLKKVESIENAKSVFFSTTNDEPDGVIESTAEQITIFIKDNTAEEAIYINSIPGKYHPEPFVAGKEREFYLPNFVKEDNKPIRPEVNIR